MAQIYTVLEIVTIVRSNQTLTRTIYTGELDRDIIEGRLSAQFRDFGPRYFIDGRVLKEDVDEPYGSGSIKYSCHFERM